MARVQIQMPEEFLLRVSRLQSETDTIIPKVLAEGGKVALASVAGNLGSVVGVGTKRDSRSTGELQRSLGVSPAKRGRDENYDVKVGFAEPRRGPGRSNAKIANVLEYGRHGQPPKPFLRPARRKSRKAIIAAMIAKFESEVESL